MPDVLDFETCNAARLRRDPAYDGRFFIAVRTTMIYCRPVCRVKPPLARNVTFYPSAAAAEAAGYRPCLRCRPETTPYSAAWNGTRTTVARALRLIEEGALDRGAPRDAGSAQDAGDPTVGALAARLGVGPRHLSRLFATHLGASPLQVAHTLRLARARRLLADTALPMAEVAARAGFGSLRRFNDSFARLYGRPPSALRRPRR